MKTITVKRLLDARFPPAAKEQDEPDEADSPAACSPGVRSGLQSKPATDEQPTPERKSVMKTKLLITGLAATLLAGISTSARADEKRDLARAAAALDAAAKIESDHDRVFTAMAADRKSVV